MSHNIAFLLAIPSAKLVGEFYALSISPSCLKSFYIEAVAGIHTSAWFCLLCRPRALLFSSSGYLTGLWIKFATQLCDNTTVGVYILGLHSILLISFLKTL